MSLDNILIVEVLNPDQKLLARSLSRKFLHALVEGRKRGDVAVEGAFFLVDDLLAAWVKAGIIPQELTEGMKEALSNLVHLAQELEYYSCLDPMTRVKLVEQHAMIGEISLEEK